VEFCGGDCRQHDKVLSPTDILDSLSDDAGVPAAGLPSDSLRSRGGQGRDAPLTQCLPVVGILDRICASGHRRDADSGMSGVSPRALEIV